jgi:hypothetical protein
LVLTTLRKQSRPRTRGNLKRAQAEKLGPFFGPSPLFPRELPGS